MLFTYSKKLKEVSLYKETDFKSQNILERQDFEKWIETSPEILGEELLILTTEFDEFDKTDERLDLLAIDKKGALVIIELKRDDSGKTVELQAVKYAAYCSTLTLKDISDLFQNYLSKKGKKYSTDEAQKIITDFIDSSEFEELSDRPRIILASKDFRPEVTATVLWLRKFEVDIKCVKITPYEMNNDTIVFESNKIIPLPEAEEYMVKAERKEASEHGFTLSQQEYLEFYRDMVEKLETKLKIGLPESTPRSYYQIPTGISSFHFEWAFHGRPRDSFGVELHFEKGNRKINEKVIDVLENMKSKIESQLEEKIIFQRDWGKVWARIYVLKNEGKMTVDLKNWGVNTMEIFYKLLQPELEKIKSEI